ncbi:MAG: endonuclease [Planctomycetota bacterium]|nr:MAG: endonuclease [Planctomycetota bacterium]
MRPPMMFALVLVALAASLFAPGRSIAEDTMRVMTFNIRYGSAGDGENAWEKRKDMLVETIRTFDPDLLGTQEVLAMQADFLAEELSDYTLVGVGRDDGQRRGELSAVLFKTKRFELLDSGTFWLSETPDVPGSKSWDSSLPRIATWVKLADREADELELCFLNTHWDHRGRRARVEAGRIIREWLSENAAGMPTIMTGDLNVTDTHRGFASLLTADADPRLVDVYRQAHPEAADDEATSHGFSGRRRGRRIDFILASPEWAATHAAINYTNRDGRYPSDHYPIEAVLQAKGQ